MEPTLDELRKNYENDRTSVSALELLKALEKEEGLLDYKFMSNYGVDENGEERDGYHESISVEDLKQSMVDMFFAEVRKVDLKEFK